MKKLKAAFLTLSIVSAVGFSTNAFAYTYDEGYLGTSSIKAYGQLFASNPGSGYPRAYATTESSVAIHTKRATVEVIYSNGTLAQNSSLAPTSSNTAAVTSTLVADAETGVGFNGYHYATDSNYGSWSGFTYVTY